LRISPRLGKYDKLRVALQLFAQNNLSVFPLAFSTNTWRELTFSLPVG
jgi:hypothetical protein